ncbi:hypothetical protein [Paracoccus sp. PAR01]|uniref:hypothetical protein n=1 Tax=Paracoccus sp. PAR01 TaxID=2769282 RepID=UPI001CE1683C|nr:hypothetical protein [Paracoccus sp. PAR01]
MDDRVREKNAEYTADPASQANNVKALKGREGIRLRVGDWHVDLTSECKRVK